MRRTRWVTAAVRSAETATGVCLSDSRSMLAGIEVLRRRKRYMSTRNPPVGQCHSVGSLARVSNVVFILTTSHISRLRLNCRFCYQLCEPCSMAGIPVLSILDTSGREAIYEREGRVCSQTLTSGPRRTPSNDMGVLEVSVAFDDPSFDLPPLSKV